MEFDSTIGKRPESSKILRKKFPNSLFCFVLQDGPGEAAVAALEQESETPERMWTRSMATSTAEELASLSSAARSHQVSLSVRQCTPSAHRALPGASIPRFCRPECLGLPLSASAP